MTDIVKRNAGQMMEWDPLRAMRDLLRWDPFREMAPMIPSLERAAFNPHFDVTETKDGYVFKADVPGVKAEELEITTTGNRLQICGKRDLEREEKGDTAFTYERQFGSFVRTFTLPEGADIEHVRTELRDGVLTMVVPKIAAAMPKKIAVGTGGDKS